VLFVILCSWGNPLFSQEKQVKKAPDSLSLQLPDTTTVFLPDTMGVKKKWETGGKLGLTVSQIWLNNWMAGGQSSVTLAGHTRIYANLKKKYSVWNNSLDLHLGFVMQGKTFEKTIDKIDFLSEKRRYLKGRWFYSGRLNFRSQMLPGYANPGDTAIISNFMAPGYIFLTLGVDYHPWKGHTLLLAPLSSKMTIVADQALANKGAFGVIKATFDEFSDIILSLGKNLKYEFGGYITYAYAGSITKTTTLETKLELFSNYLKKPQNIDVNWEVLGRVKISEVFSVNLYGHLIYDDDIKMETDDEGNVLQGPKTQFMEIMGLGVTFTW
jgi:hypothetical protein